MTASPKSDCPPKPLLTLRVGITGHRPDKLKSETVGRVERQLSQVFKAIEAAAANILAANKTVYSDATPAFRLTCGFAEGADLLAVKACPGSWQIEAVLPFPQDEYIKDFRRSAAGDGRDVSGEFREAIKKATTITELPAPRPNDRSRSYVDAGGYLLRQADVLVAVWDGKKPKPGGTGAIARKAFDGGIPLVWISTVQDCAPRLVTGFDDAGAPDAPEIDCTDGPLQEALWPIFAAPTGRKGRRSSRAGLERYLCEFWRHNTYWTAFDFFKRVATLTWPRLRVRSEHPDKRKGEWVRFLESAPPVKNLRMRLEEVLLPRFLWADELAVHFSHRYRSVYVLAYFLSAIAVMVALTGIFFDHGEHALRTKASFVLLELIIIGFVLGIVIVGRWWLWHERWLQYRALAENLRHARFLAFVSEFGRIHVPSENVESDGSSWVLWYIRATAREIGLPTAVLQSNYQWRLLNATLTHEIREQVAWHRSNMHASQRMDHILHDFGTFCFLLTFVALAVFLLSYGYDLLWPGPIGTWLLKVKPLVTFIAAGFPALGAALAGIRVQGDFEGSRARSQAMVEVLGRLGEEFRRAEDHAVLEETSQMLINTAQAMSEDVAAWQDLYGRKRLNLPA
jgi:hypothetical protein